MSLAEMANRSSLGTVIPAKAGIQRPSGFLDPGLRRDDEVL